MEIFDQDILHVSCILLLILVYNYTIHTSANKNFGRKDLPFLFRYKLHPSSDIL